LAILNVANKSLHRTATALRYIAAGELYVRFHRLDRKMNGITLQSNEMQKIDPFYESVDSMLVVAFPKSSSKNFSFALSVAESASKFAITEINKKIMYVAVFSKSPADAGKAKVLLSYTNSWKGTLIFHGGNLLRGGFEVSRVIDCYAKSESCKDPKAHCNTVVTPYGFGEKPYLFPCKLISYHFKLHSVHPSSIEDQIQALAVNHGCEWCPNFHPENFKLVEEPFCEKEVRPSYMQIENNQNEI
jgi:hypothetical protein